MIPFMSGTPTSVTISILNMSIALAPSLATVVACTASALMLELAFITIFLGENIIWNGSDKVRHLKISVNLDFQEGKYP